MRLKAAEKERKEREQMKLVKNVEHALQLPEAAAVSWFRELYSSRTQRERSPRRSSGEGKAVADTEQQGDDLDLDVDVDIEL